MELGQLPRRSGQGLTSKEGIELEGNIQHRPIPKLGGVVYF